MGHKLPTPAKPVATYIMCTRVGNLIYTGKHFAKRSVHRIHVQVSHTYAA